MKTRPVGTAVPCSQKDGRTHMTKLTVAFSNFANAPKNSTYNGPYVSLSTQHILISHYYYEMTCP